MNYIIRVFFLILIQEPKKPKRNLVADADLHTIVYNIAVGNVPYLAETFALATDLKQILSIHKKIALRRIGHVMSDPQLVEEESLASPFLPAE